jgi:hypothetical protein
MNNNKPKGIYMKTSYKLILAACLAASLAGTLTGCKQIPLEQEIAVKEPGSWDFAVKSSNHSGNAYVRIYDSPEKLGWFKYEYGQKSPCNQGFQKVTKTTAPGLVQYSNEHTKSFACGEKIRYIFRTDANGHPYEGWGSGIKDHEKKEFNELASTVRYWDAKGMKPNYFLVK